MTYLPDGSRWRYSSCPQEHSHLEQRGAGADTGNRHRHLRVQIIAELHHVVVGPCHEVHVPSQLLTNHLMTIRLSISMTSMHVHPRGDFEFCDCL